jgi:PAS domain S-box-containing protein/putative nucleotidyltransferase with HDIG domain
MISERFKQDAKDRFKQLEWLIIGMAGTTLGSLQIVHYIFFSTGIQITILQTLLDWVFSMAIITFLVHFSFQQIGKFQEEMIEKRDQANKAEKRLQHIIDCTQDTIFLIDPNNHFIYASKSIETMTGYPVEDILNMNMAEIVNESDRNFLLKQLSDIKNLSGKHLYVDLLHKDNRMIPVELSFMQIQLEGENTAFQCLARDITERKETEKAHMEKERYLKAIATVGQTIIGSKEEIPYKTILDSLVDASESQQAFVLLNSNNDSWKLFTNKNQDNILINLNDMDDPYIRGFIHSDTENQADDDKHNGNGNGNGNGHGNGDGKKSDVNTLLAESKNYSCDILPLLKNDNSNKFTLPIMVDDKLAGIIGFNRSNNGPGYKQSQLNMIAIAAGMLSQAIERQHTHKELKHHFISLASVISKALFVLDPYTAIHQKRCAIMASKLGEELGLEKEKIEWLHFGALLHDIGKVAIPGTILSKPGQLTTEEWALLRSHAKRGHELLQDINLPDFVTDMILYHHERLDGSGYPFGISGDKLSLEVKILSICDVVEAMSSHRPYRPARTREEICTELEQGKGIKYDNSVIDIMLRMIEANEIDLSGVSATQIKKVE